MTRPSSVVTPTLFFLALCTVCAGLLVATRALQPEWGLNASVATVILTIFLVIQSGLLLFAVTLLLDVITPSKRQGDITLALCVSANLFFFLYLLTSP